MRGYVAVVGPGDGATAEDLTAAYDVGRLLAEAGCVVVTGGRGGVMAAAGDGCASVGGVSVGLLPDSDRLNAASSTTITIPTGVGELRNGLVVRAADAVIAIGGSWGTLSEIGLAMRAGLPVVVIRGWRLFDDAGGEVAMVRVDSAAKAVAAILDALTA